MQVYSPEFLKQCHNQKQKSNMKTNSTLNKLKINSVKDASFSPKVNKESWRASNRQHSFVKNCLKGKMEKKRLASHDYYRSLFSTVNSNTIDTFGENDRQKNKRHSVIIDDISTDKFILPAVSEKIYRIRRCLVPPKTTDTCPNSWGGTRQRWFFIFKKLPKFSKVLLLLYQKCDWRVVLLLFYRI